MIAINIPGNKNLNIEHLVIDYNGTLAEDGLPVKGTKDRLKDLSEHLDIHIITADTHGTVKELLKDFPCQIIVIKGNSQDKKKLNYIQKLGLKKTAAIGNGRNDVLMIRESALGIAVLLKEGCYSKTMFNSDLIVKSINDALDLFIKTNRLIAGLRNA